MNEATLRRRARAIVDHAGRVGCDVPNPYEALAIARHFPWHTLDGVTFKRTAPGRYDIHMPPPPGYEDDPDAGCIQSSPNVFASLAIENPEEQGFKSQLRLALHDAMVARGLSKPKAAELLGLTADELKRFLSGRSCEHSIEEMVRFLLLLGYEPEIVVPGLDNVNRAG